jgi:probable F420-dependent oxidoreductase
MRIGVAFPTTEIGSDREMIRDFAQGVEGLGYQHLTCIDHVIQGTEPEADDWRAYYTLDNAFHEPMVTLGFIAGATRELELVTAILILPQRPAVLAAKQFAALDVMTGGRTRVGVGIGWNRLEFAALGQPFAERAARFEEQIALMRALWQGGPIRFDGKWHSIEDAGINPAPVSQPLPIWIGAFVPAAIRRAGRLADGWFLNPRESPEEAQANIEVFAGAAIAAGRDPQTLGMEATLLVADKSDDMLSTELDAWRAAGVSHLTVRTMSSGLTGADAHLKAMERVSRLM